MVRVRARHVLMDQRQLAALRERCDLDRYAGVDVRVFRRRQGEDQAPRRNDLDIFADVLRQVVSVSPIHEAE